MLNAHPHQMVIVPILAPDTIAWLCVSFKIRHILVDELQQLTQAHVSLLQITRPDKTSLLTSSLGDSTSKALITKFATINWQNAETIPLELNQTHYLSSVAKLASNDNVSIIAVLQKSLDKELTPFYRLQWVLLAIALASLLLALIGGLLVARSVSKPVKKLVEGVREVGKGRYDYRIAVHSSDELGELGLAFNEMAIRKGQQEALRQAKESAESASQAKSEFLANMSHELRTPLNSILGYAQLLQRSNLPREKQLNSLQTIEQSGQHLLSLINEILDLSKIESGRLELQPTSFDIHRMLVNIMTTLQTRANTKGLTLEGDFSLQDSLWVKADELRLRQVLINLVDNAIKYTETGKVLFKVEFDDGRYHFLIEDTGIGIAQEHLKDIFTSFLQLHQPTHSYVEGTGLGLAICDQLVRLMGGQLYVTSQLSQGSRFWFDLALPQADHEKQSKTSVTEGQKIAALNGGRRKILITDDEAENRLLLTDMLSGFDFELRQALNGQDCINQAQEWQPDLILMDSKMPVIDGLEACSLIRNTANIKDIKIISISANAYEHHHQNCLEAGANDFLAKPFQLEALLLMIALQIDLKPVYKTRKIVVSSTNKRFEETASFPPKQLLQELLNSAEQGDIQAVREQIKTLDLAGTDHLSFQAKLNSLADDFQINKICQLIKQAIETQGEKT